jgi:hypothetical protein
MSLLQAHVPSIGRIRDVPDATYSRDTWPADDDRWRWDHDGMSATTAAVRRASPCTRAPARRSRQASASTRSEGSPRRPSRSGERGRARTSSRRWSDRRSGRWPGKRSRSRSWSLCSWRRARGPPRRGPRRCARPHRPPADRRRGCRPTYRSEKAMESLRAAAAPVARVRRDGRTDDIAAAELVPGDVVLLRAARSSRQTCA